MDKFADELTLHHIMGHSEYSGQTPEGLYALGVKYRQEGRFGDAINAFYAAAEMAGSLLASMGDGSGSIASGMSAIEDIKKKSLASVELIQEINGFVNTDLMNP